MKIAVYLISDPRDGVVRYVGQTRNLRSRKRAHLSGLQASPRMKVWLDQLAAAGLAPNFAVIAELDAAAATVAEAALIRALASTVFNNSHLPKVGVAVLLNPSVYRALNALSREQGRSISEAMSDAFVTFGSEVSSVQRTSLPMRARMQTSVRLTKDAHAILKSLARRFRASNEEVISAVILLATRRARRGRAAA